jgi:hypothetical protein
MYSSSKPVTGQHYEYVRFDTLEFFRPLIKGKEYVLKVTHSDGDSINWYADTTNPYQYGRMFVGGDAPLRWDLVARIEGVNRAVSGELSSDIDVTPKCH